MDSMKTFLLLLVASALSLAQSITPSVSPATVVAGKTSTLTLTFAPGSTAASAIQWSVTPPTGVTVSAWTIGAAGTSASKSLTCAGTSTQICVLAGLNTTAIGSGVVATATVTLASSDRGSEVESLAGVLGASATAASIAVTGGSATLTATSPFDLNQDGVVNALDLALAIQQVDGTAVCNAPGNNPITADFNGDGVCNVLDLILLVLDSQSATP